LSGAEQAAWDPYGRPDKAGSSAPDNASKGSTFGFQGAATDRVSGSLVLGARQYDPKTARFTTPDYFVAAQLDLSLGADPLTGNRYLFAGANPASFYENGYWPSWKSIGRFAKRVLANRVVRGVAIGVAIGAVCGATAGLGCAVGVGAGVGALWGGANYVANAKHRSLRGFVGAVVGGAKSGAIEGATQWGAGKVLRAVLPAKTAVRAAASEAEGTLAGGRAAANPLGGTLNCAACAIAGDARLAGNAAVALDTGPQLVSTIERTVGGTFRPVAGQAEITSILEEAGSGARGIVFGDRGVGAVGHVWNAVNQGGAIRFIDFQSGAAASFEGYKGFEFLLTFGGG
jgi:RHS repeat-associated protein